MVRVTALYGHPENPDAFEEHYANTHTPLVINIVLRVREGFGYGADPTPEPWVARGGAGRSEHLYATPGGALGGRLSLFRAVGRLPLVLPGSPLAVRGGKG